MRFYRPRGPNVPNNRTDTSIRATRWDLIFSTQVFLKTMCAPLYQVLGSLRTTHRRYDLGQVGVYDYAGHPGPNWRPGPTPFNGGAYIVHRSIFQQGVALLTFWATYPGLNNAVPNNLGRNNILCRLHIPGASLYRSFGRLPRPKECGALVYIRKGLIHAPAMP